MVEQWPFKPKVVGSIPTAPTKNCVFTAFHSVFNNKTNLTTIKLIHPVLSDACRTVFNRIPLLVSNHVAVYSQCDSRVTMAKLFLHHSRSCTVCEEGTGSTVPHRMEPAAWNAQLHQERVKLFFA